jgi:type VI secretion system protein ImpM
VRLAPSAGDVLAGGSHGGWHIATGSSADLSTLFGELLTARLETLYDPLVIWWTSGSTMVEPACLIGSGLPAPEAFAALLDGSWERRHWVRVQAQVDPDSPADADALVDDPTPPRYRSAGATDTGRVRTINQDCYLERADVGLWVVADGVGGHSHGEIASRMVCDALADFLPHASFEGVIQQATERLQEVNDHLVRAGARPDHTVISGSTVVALLVRGTRCAVLWAGDSRAYRVRQGRLEQLTSDHSVDADVPGGAGAPSTTAITRAVGAEPTLSVDVYRDRVRAGDRFLLCSDGLTRIVPEPRILEWMEHEYISAAVQGLMNACLDAGAPDNVTVVVVEAYAPGWV